MVPFFWSFFYKKPVTRFGNKVEPRRKEEKEKKEREKREKKEKKRESGNENKGGYISPPYETGHAPLFFFSRQLAPRDEEHSIRMPVQAWAVKEKQVPLHEMRQAGGTALSEKTRSHSLHLLLPPLPYDVSHRLFEHGLRFASFCCICSFRVFLPIPGQPRRA